MKAFKKIVILTGAGISAESGLGTFRDKDGAWTKYDLNEVATPEGFARNPALVHEFYNKRRRAGHEASHNQAHTALARLEREHDGQVLIVTQNIDALHEEAGSVHVIHMHGEANKALCTGCGDSHDWPGDMKVDETCPSCAKIGLRPDIVWFGEMPYHMERIYSELAGCDLFISIGTSGTVYPAAGFVAEATGAGAHTVELNLEPSTGASHFADSINGKASRIVPDYVDRLLHQLR